MHKIIIILHLLTIEFVILKKFFMNKNAENKMKLLDI